MVQTIYRRKNDFLQELKKKVCKEKGKGAKNVTFYSLALQIISTLKGVTGDGNHHANFM